MEFVAPHIIRTLFSRAMSEMYQEEVPQYGTLLKIVHEVNTATLATNPELLALLTKNNELARINEERHGAIRLGKAEELQTIRKLFAVMGMQPVGYYDLSIAAIPVHATAFRPINDLELKHNPFRIFTSLLRTELIEDSELREMAIQLLESRDIFTPGVRRFIALNQTQGGLSLKEAEQFVQEALETFRWHDKAITSLDVHNTLNELHPLIADVVCFNGPHINHLTPRTLDISSIQNRMQEQGLNPKAIIEGPPERTVPILLRQTSFKALEEAILFPSQQGHYEPGTHKARFGEIEQRGVALTPKGKQWYAKLLDKVRAKIIPAIDGSNAPEYEHVLKAEFMLFPDSFEELRQQGLVYLHYTATEKGIQHAGFIHNKEINYLIENNFIEYCPMVYEDFLPISAAGIFTSNLGTVNPFTPSSTGNQDAFEKALGTKVINPFTLYSQKEKDSLAAAFSALGITD